MTALPFPLQSFRALQLGQSVWLKPTGLSLLDHNKYVCVYHIAIATP